MRFILLSSLLIVQIIAVGRKVCKVCKVDEKMSFTYFDVTDQSVFRYQSYFTALGTLVTTNIAFNTIC